MQALPLAMKLPIGIQSFAKLRNGGYYYVDKTPMAWQLSEASGYFFLSRPRRFGKSLFLDTLKEMFEGHETLFHGLFIHDKWDWTRTWPVIRISFAGGNLRTVEALEQSLRQQLEEHERQFGLPSRYHESNRRFRDLIARLHQQSGQQVVVLVDEYDKPMLDRIEDTGIALAMREALKDFYSVIKDLDAHLRFVFLTGVSKFSKVSLFSGLNNLNDITLDPLYSSICGYTEQDLDTVFAAEMAGLERKEVRRWYNGYGWLGESVYNPYDLLLLFDKRTFQPWWFETGTPTFLIKLLAREGFFTPDLAAMSTGAELISTFDVDQISAEALLFQTGYLTIRGSEQTPSGNWRYLLGYPNREVEASLNISLLGAYLAGTGNIKKRRFKLEDLLLASDIVGLRDLFQSFFASIPHQWFDNNPIARYEGFYASVFYSYFAALGYPLHVEDATNHGRIDMVVIMPQTIFLFEFKVVELLPSGHALQQLKERNYAEKYLGHGLPIQLIGIEFSREARNVAAFDAELVCVTKADIGAGRE